MKVHHLIRVAFMVFLLSFKLKLHHAGTAAGTPLAFIHEYKELHNKELHNHEGYCLFAKGIY